MLVKRLHIASRHSHLNIFCGHQCGCQNRTMVTTWCSCSGMIEKDSSRGLNLFRKIINPRAGNWSCLSSTWPCSPILSKPGNHFWSVCSDQFDLGFEPVWRTTHLLTQNRKRFDHLLYTKLNSVYQTDQTTLGCSIWYVRTYVHLNTNGSHRTEIHCTKINCFKRGNCFLLFRLSIIQTVQNTFPVNFD